MRAIIIYIFLFMVSVDVASAGPADSHIFDRYEGCWDTVSVDGKVIGKNPRLDQFKKTRWVESAKFWLSPDGKEIEAFEGSFFVGYRAPFNVYEYIGIPIGLGQTSIQGNQRFYEYRGQLQERRTRALFDIELRMQVNELDKRNIEVYLERSYPSNSAYNINRVYVLTRCGETQ